MGTGASKRRAEARRELERVQEQLERKESDAAELRERAEEEAAIAEQTRVATEAEAAKAARKVEKAREAEAEAAAARRVAQESFDDTQRRLRKERDAVAEVKMRREALEARTTVLEEVTERARRESVEFKEVAYAGLSKVATGTSWTCIATSPPPWDYYKPTDNGDGAEQAP